MRKNDKATTRRGELRRTKEFDHSDLDDQLKWRRYLRVLLDRKLTIVVVLAVVTVGATAWMLRQTPIFRSTATVQVDIRAPSVLGRDVEQVEELGTGSYWNNQEYLKTQHKIVQSREVLGRVVQSERLSNDPYFAGTPEEPLSEVAIIRFLGSKVTVHPERDSRLIRISYDDPDPERATRIANALARAYLAQNVERMQSATENALQWLEQQTEGLQRDLTDSERALYEFRNERGILSVSLQDSQNITSNQVQKLSEAVTTARLRRIELKSVIIELKRVSWDRPLDIALPPSLDTPVVQQLKLRYAELEEEREGLRKTYGETWPQVQKTDGELERIKSRLANEVDLIVQSMDSEYRAALNTERGFQAALEQSRRDGLALNLDEIEYNRLDREQKNNAKMYELVLGRTKETELARLLKVNNLRILDVAVIPERPIEPRFVRSILISILFGLVGGIVLAFFLEAMDVTVKSQSDLEELDLPFLGLIPVIEPMVEPQRKKRRRGGNRENHANNRDLIVHERPRSNIAEACRSIRTNLLFMSPERDLRTLLISSPGPCEGKTTVAISLAVVMAQSGMRVVLIDADMRRPRIQGAFGVISNVGLSSVVIGQASLDQVVAQTVVDGLSIVPSGPVPPNPAELLHTERFSNLMAELAERFDRVIVDSPPLGAVTDPAVLSTQVDSVVLVLKSGVTRKDGARQALSEFSELGAPVLGGVLNQVNLSRQQSGYHYHRQKGHRYYPYDEDVGTSRVEPLATPRSDSSYVEGATPRDQIGRHELDSSQWT